MALKSTKSTASNAGKKSNAAKKAEAKAETTEEEDAAAAAEAEAAAEARKESLLDLKGRLDDTIHDLKANDKASAEAARLSWVKVGNLLIEGQQMFLKGNEVNDQEFGRWIVAEKLDTIGQRPTRAAAVWLSKVYNEKPDLYALFPTESQNGEPLRRSPRTLKDWVRDRMNEVFQLAYDKAEDDLAVPSDAGKDKAARKPVAEAGIGNVYDVLTAEIDASEANVEKLAEAMKTAKKDARGKAMDAYSEARDRHDRLEQAKAIMDCHTTEERVDAFMSWRPKVQSVPFKECDVQEAA